MYKEKLSRTQGEALSTSSIRPAWYIWYHCMSFETKIRLKIFNTSYANLFVYCRRKKNVYTDCLTSEFRWLTYPALANEIRTQFFSFSSIYAFTNITGVSIPDLFIYRKKYEKKFFHERWDVRSLWRVVIQQKSLSEDDKLYKYIYIYICSLIPVG